MKILSSVLDRVKPSATLESGRRIAELRAQGRSVIALNAGQPDFDTPAHIKQAAVQAIERGETRYTPVAGLPQLRAAISRKLVRENGLEFAVNEIMVATGGKQIIANAMMGTVETGDEIVIPAPYWVTYPEITAMCGGTPVIVPTRAEDGYKVTARALAVAISHRTKWLILNTPSNPSGAVYSATELRQIADVLLKHPHVWVMTDELYEHLIYADTQAASILTIEPALRERTLVVNGLSKAYAMTGWRVGYGAGPAKLIEAMCTIQSQTTTSACSISQWAAVEALDGPQGFLDQWRSIFKKRRDLVIGRLANARGLECSRPDGAFYVFPSCAKLFGAMAPSGQLIQSDIDFVRELLEYAGVGVVAGSGFGFSSNFRISYAASTNDLEVACDRIVDFCNCLSI